MLRFAVEKLKENVSKSNEHRYTYIRAVVSSLFFIYLLIDYALQSSVKLDLILLGGIHFGLSLLAIFILKKGYFNFTVRQTVTNLVDISIISTFIYLNDLSSSVVYPLLLWIVMGNGVRFGPKYFYSTLLLTAVAFYIATSTNQHWESMPQFKYSLLVGFLVLSLYYNRLIESMYKMNVDLDSMVKQRTNELEYQLYHNKLTGLKNMDALQEDIKKSFSSIMLIDIDKFQDYNDLYGLEVGNLVLKKFAALLDAFAQEHNYEAYHVYTDGFFLRSKEKFAMPDKIFEDVTNLMERITSYKITFRHDEEDIDLEIDATIAISMEKEHAIEKANIALKHAKKERRNYQAYYKGLDSQKELADILSWRKRIKDAIHEDRVVPFFQPIVDKEGNTLKYEALIRIKERDEGGRINVLSPFKFLDIAIKTKQYSSLTKIMIEKSFAAMKNLESDISINLQYSDIKNSTTMTTLKELIKTYDMAHRLVLEIVESEDVKDFALLKRVLNQFKEMGVKIAIDDFGSGFSNFTNILDIFPDYLKIDGSLIKEIDKNTNSYKLVSSIVTLASSLGIKTIAEFVHSKEVFEVSQKIGIDEFQGYYFSEPIDEEKLLKQEAKLPALV